MVSQIKEGWENLWKGKKIKEENMEGKGRIRKEG